MVKKAEVISRFGISTLAAGLSVAISGRALRPGALTTQAAPSNGGGPKLLIGSDDDNQDNAAISAGATANQSLNRTDVLRSAGPATT